MPAILPSLARSAALGALIVAIVASVAAQETPVRVLPTLCVLVQVKNLDVSPKEIEETMQTGAEKLGYQYSSVRADPLKPETYEDMQRFITQLETARTSAAEGKPIIRQKVSDPRVEYEFDLNIARDGKRLPALLTRIDLTVRSDDKNKTRTVVLEKPRPATIARPDDPLIATALDGVYVIRLSPGEVPVKYKAFFKTGDEPGLEKEISGDWQPPVKYFIVTLKDFKGDHHKLLQFVKRNPELSKQNVANPLDDVELGPDVAMVFASVGFKLRRPGSRFGTNSWIPVVDPFEKEFSDRVWMLFPLSRKDVEAAVKEYTTSPNQLSKKIRESKPLWAADNPEIVLTSDMKPTWIELPRTENGQFSRSLKFQDARQMYKEWKEAYRLLVYELGDRENSSAQAQEHPVTQKRVFVIDEPIREWPDGLREIADKARGPDRIPEKTPDKKPTRDKDEK